jgi:hypothetical protein
VKTLPTTIGKSLAGTCRLNACMLNLAATLQSLMLALRFRNRIALVDTQAVASEFSHSLGQKQTYVELLGSEEAGNNMRSTSARKSAV